MGWYEIIGQPADLAYQDRYQFRSWALPRIKAKPSQDKKGADQSTDGVLFFMDKARKPHKKVVIQVKSGHVQARHICDLARLVEREKAVACFLFSQERPTQPMLKEALNDGYYRSPGWKRGDQKVQVRTIEHILAHESAVDGPAPRR